MEKKEKVCCEERNKIRQKTPFFARMPLGQNGAGSDRALCLLEEILNGIAASED
jgi:hypothetical protein